GLHDSFDFCPTDPLNRCAGPVATCGTGAASDCAAGTDLRFDLGGTAPRTDCNGDVWTDDTGAGGDYVGGNLSGTVSDAFGCADTDTEVLVQSFAFLNPDLSRSYPIANGAYFVNMLFAETDPQACIPGRRVMDISIEGRLVYEDFDTYGAAANQHGAVNACGGLVVRSAGAHVTDGTLDIELTEITGGEAAILNAIEVIEITP
ncbi:MAG: malectin domain-containing carbohydrate-binding protein, partial [Acidobacteriota bacterium]|nr:malectin domain-containing carbohydrate-binding protein [Acidobacteriota bacterium]